MTIVRSSVFWLQPRSISSTASQSSSSGCDGGWPCVPKSSLVSTRPRPNSCSHRRLTLDARDQRVVAIDQPAGQAEAVGRQRVLHRRQRQRRARVHPLAARREGAALAQLVGRPLEAGAILHHQRARELQVDERLARRLERVARRRQPAASSGGSARRRRRRRPRCGAPASGATIGRSAAGSVAPISGSAAVVAASRKRPMPWPIAPSSCAMRSVTRVPPGKPNGRAALQHRVARQARSSRAAR